MGSRDPGLPQGVAVEFIDENGGGPGSAFRNGVQKKQIEHSRFY